MYFYWTIDTYCLTAWWFFNCHQLLVDVYCGNTWPIHQHSIVNVAESTRHRPLHKSYAECYKVDVLRRLRKTVTGHFLFVWDIMMNYLDVNVPLNGITTNHFLLCQIFHLWFIFFTLELFSVENLILPHHLWHLTNPGSVGKQHGNCLWSIHLPGIVASYTFACVDAIELLQLKTIKIRVAIIYRSYCFLNDG